MFKDRIEAGRQLGQKIHEKYPEIKDGIILGLPRGGVVVGKEVAKIMNLPLDIIVTRKIGAPLNQEFAIAAISEHGIVFNSNEDIDPEYLARETMKERNEIKRRYKEYRKAKKTLFNESTVIFLVDDGLATGLTMRAAIKELKRYKPKKIIVAVPVAPPETKRELEKSVDEVIVLEIEPLFWAVGQFYQDFPQVSDEEVKNLLQ